MDLQCHACCTLPIRLTHRLTYPIVGLDRNSDGFLDAVAYPPPCSEIELDSFPGRSSPETPRGETPSKIPVSASTNNCAEVQP